jgi:hypothetical protein
MGETHLRISVKNGKTVTRIGKSRNNEKIVFSNEGAGTLTITFDKDVLDPADGTRPQRIRHRGHYVYSFAMLRGDKKTFRVKPDTRLETELKYTAQITGSEREDPIIIIEK